MDQPATIRGSAWAAPAEAGNRVDGCLDIKQDFLSTLAPENQTGKSDEEEEKHQCSEVCMKVDDHMSFQCPYLDDIPNPEKALVGQGSEICCHHCLKSDHGHSDGRWKGFARKTSLNWAKMMMPVMKMKKSHIQMKKSLNQMMSLNFVKVVNHFSVECPYFGLCGLKYLEFLTSVQVFLTWFSEDDVLHIGTKSNHHIDIVVVFCFARTEDRDHSWKPLRDLSDLDSLRNSEHRREDQGSYACRETNRIPRGDGLLRPIQFGILWQYGYLVKLGDSPPS
ncbi:hypothetical protein ACLB2K_065902 [Fragaria x ananassa]